jgi:hypothetical protein
MWGAADCSVGKNRSKRNSRINVADAQVVASGDNARNSKKRNAIESGKEQASRSRKNQACYPVNGVADTADPTVGVVINVMIKTYS